MVIVALEMSCNCAIIIVFDVKYMTLESIYDSILCLSYMFNMAPVAFQAIYQVITLASAFGNCIVGFVVVLSFLFSLIGRFFGLLIVELFTGLFIGLFTCKVGEVFSVFSLLELVSAFFIKIRCQFEIVWNCIILHLRFFFSIVSI